MKFKQTSKVMITALAVGLLPASAWGYSLPNPADTTVNGTRYIHNDAGNTALENAHIDANIAHMEYEEELERGHIDRSLEHEISETNDVKEKIIKQANLTQDDHNAMTSFFSNDDHEHDTYQNDIFAGGNDFYYKHLLPPGVRPDVNDAPYFNDYDFTHDLIEFELEIEGWVTADPGTETTTFEVFLDDLRYDANGTLTRGNDIASLGKITIDKEVWGDKDSDDHVDDDEFHDDDHDGHMDTGEWHDDNGDGHLDTGEWHDDDHDGKVDSGELKDRDHDGKLDTGEWHDDDGDGKLDTGEWEDHDHDGRVDENEVSRHDDEHDDDGDGKTDRWEFGFKFEQYNDPLGPAFISQEIYDALATGALGIHIQRTGGTAALYLESSELELEQPDASPVPEPATMFLLETGLVALAGTCRKRKSA